MDTHPGNEPTWYHAAVDADAVAFTPPADDTPNRKVMAVAAVLIVVILGSIGVSVSALRGEPADSADASLDSARTVDLDGEDADGGDGAGSDPSGDETAGDAAADDGGSEDRDEPTATGSSDGPVTRKAPTGTGSTTRPTQEAPKPTTTAPKPTTTTEAPHDQTPPTTAPKAPAPEVTSVSAPGTYACSEAPHFEDPGTLTLSWTTTNATSVTVSIDSPGGVYQSGLPADGSLTVPAPCSPNSNTYYVTAHGEDGLTHTKSVTTKGI